MIQTENLEITTEFKMALEHMRDGDGHLFITGKAGTGKSTLLELFRANSQEEPIILAPTGVAALNVNGVTIHSFFGFSIDITPERVRDTSYAPRKRSLYRNLKTIIIDEVSMVRADLLDCIEIFLHRFGPHPKQAFGGVRMIFIGDLYQLPPVVLSDQREIFRTRYTGPFFFHAQAMADAPLKIVELQKIFRQSDTTFINLLNRIRNNTVEDEDMHLLNSRYDPNFEPPAGSNYIYLTATNKLADALNQERLRALKGALHVSEAIIDGTFGREYIPTAPTLEFKIGAQIMLLNNDSEGRWINGTLGVVEKIKPDTDEREPAVQVRLQDNDALVSIFPYTWEIYRFGIANNAVVSELIGSFTQYPFRLAWAVTIHKSQGKTFDNIIIDVGSGLFATGQMYVALSRCTSLAGIVLAKLAKKSHIRVDWKIQEFLTTYQYQQSAKLLSEEDKYALITEAIKTKSTLRMVYLKANDTKSERIIKPMTLGEEEYANHAFMGMVAYCMSRKAERMFNVDRILQLEQVE